MSFRNSFLVLLFGGTLGMFLLREQQRGILEPFDSVHREFLKANSAPGQAPVASSAPAVVFGRLDDVDQRNRVFESWPPGQGDWQVILQNLAGYQPKALAIAAPLPFDKAGSGLEAAAKSIARLITGAPASVSAGDGPQVLPDGLPVLRCNGPVSNIPEFKSIRPSAIPAIPGAGGIDMQPRQQELSVDGDWCRVPLLARLGEKVVPTLALRALLEGSGVPAAEVTVEPGHAITDGKSLRIPIDDAGFFRYFLSLAPEVPAVNADVFVLTREQALANLPPDDPQRSILAALPQSLLWIGQDNAAGRVLKLPNGTPVSSAYLTARALAAIQTARFMRPLPPLQQWMMPAGTLLFCLWLTHWRKSRLWPGAFVAAITLAGISLYFYRRDDLWIPLVPSLAMLTATLILSFLLPAAGRESVPASSPPGNRTRTAAPSGLRTTSRSKVPPAESAANSPAQSAPSDEVAAESVAAETLDTTEARVQPHGNHPPRRTRNKKRRR